MNEKDKLLQEMNLRSPKWARNPILAGYRGSHAQGTYIPPEEAHSTDDIDVFGVLVHGPEYYHSTESMFTEQSTFVTAGETLDIESHEIRKFINLLCKGNPNVNQHLWLDSNKYFVIYRAGLILIKNRREFLSKRMLLSLSGYALSQLHRMEKFEKRGYMGTKREAIVKKYGYDIKNASHLLRLLYQGILLAQKNELLVVLPDNLKNVVMGVKRGEWSLDEVKTYAKELEQKFDDVMRESHLPLRASTDVANHICQKVIEAHWEDLKDK